MSALLTPRIQNVVSVAVAIANLVTIQENHFNAAISFHIAVVTGGKRCLANPKTFLIW